MARKSSPEQVTSTNFSNAIGLYIDKSAKNPIFITKYNRVSRVLLDAQEYMRLKALDTREFLHPSELSDELKAELQTATMDSKYDHLNKLLD